MEQPKVSGRVVNKKRLLLIGGIALVLVLLAVGVGVFFINSSKNAVANTCSDSDLKAAGNDLVNPIDQAVLSKAASNIRNSKGYENDSNCAFVTTFYELNYGSLSGAKTELAKLKKSFNPQKGYSQSIATHALSPDELQSEIDQIQASIDQSTNDPQGSAFTTPPESAQ